MKKKLLILIPAIVLSIAVIVLIVLFPYIRLLNFVNDLKNEQYTYTCFYYLELKDTEKFFEGSVEGCKDAQSVYGKIYLEDKKITEIYANNEDCLINVSPLISDRLDSIDLMNINLDLFIKDTYITLEQCSEILDVDIESKISEILNCEYSVKTTAQAPDLKFLELDNKIKNRYTISTDSMLGDFFILLGTNEEKNTVCNVILDQKEIYFEMSFSYDIGEVEEIYMPKKSLSAWEMYLLKQILNMMK